jgi:hypothetical protein
MAVPLQLRAWLLMLAGATVLPGQADALQIIRRAVAADEHNWKLARRYTFSERVDVRYLDAQGGLKSQEVKLRDVMLLEGSPYRRLVELNDRPLALADEKKEQRKLARTIGERQQESATQRAARVAEYASRPEWQREAWRELPVAFDFRLASEEMCDGRRMYVIHASPRQGYQSRSLTGKVLAHLRAILWVDSEDYHVAKAEAEAIDTIAVGLLLVRVAKGSRATLEQTHVNAEVWLPRRVRTFASARLGLLKVLRVEQEITYSKCREFQAGLPVISRIQAK